MVMIGERLEPFEVQTAVGEHSAEAVRVADDEDGDGSELLVLLQLAAEREQAVEHARQIHRTSAPFERWWLGVLEGEVALARGDHETAARAFGSGRPAGRMFFNRHLYFFMPSVLANNLILRDAPARIAIAQGRPAEAIAVYRRLLTSGPDQPWTAALEPRYVLALARLLARRAPRDWHRAQTVQLTRAVHTA